MAAAVSSSTVFRLAAQIPRGRVSTYGALADALGCRRLARRVGALLASNTDPVSVPCHRVVRSDGTVGGYRWGVMKKIRILRGEGIEVRNRRIMDFRKRMFKRFARKARA